VEAVFAVALPHKAIAAKVGWIEGDLDEIASMLCGYVSVCRLVLHFCDWSNPPTERTAHR
jgi:hypothetical protein